jgi:hypothetical protein
MRNFLAMFEADALNSTCDIETGTADQASPPTTSDLPCLISPPTIEQNNIDANFLVKDENTVVEIGSRLVHDGTYYIVKQLFRDDIYVKAACKLWLERY